MKLIRAWLRVPLEKGLGPIVDGLIVARVHPNTLTTLNNLAVSMQAQHGILERRSEHRSVSDREEW